MPKESPKTSALPEFRKMLGNLNQVDLARMLGVSRRTIQYWESGEVKTPPPVFIAVELILSNIKEFVRETVRSASAHFELHTHRTYSQFRADLPRPFRLLRHNKVHQHAVALAGQKPNELGTSVSVDHRQ